MKYIRSVLVYLYLAFKAVYGDIYFHRLEKKKDQLGEAEYLRRIHAYTHPMGEKLIALTGSKVEIKGKEHIPADGAVLFVANHQSYFDIPVMYVCMDRVTGFVAKDTLAKIPTLADWFRYLPSVTIARGEARKALEAVLQAAKLLQGGHRLVLFPEGTRSADGTLGEFKAGSLKAGQKGKAAVVPVALDGVVKLMNRSTIWMSPADITVTFLPAIPSDEANALDTNHLAAYVKRQIADTLGQPLSEAEQNLAAEAVQQLADFRAKKAEKEAENA